MCTWEHMWKHLFLDVIGRLRVLSSLLFQQLKYFCSDCCSHAFLSPCSDDSDYDDFNIAGDDGTSLSTMFK